MSLTHAQLRAMLARDDRRVLASLRPDATTASLPRTMRLTLPLPPTLNTLRAIVNNRMITTAAGRAYKTRIAQEVQVQSPGWEPLAGPVRVYLELHEAPRQHFDIDNTFKALLDAFQEALVYYNDRQIDDLHCRRSTKSTPGYMLAVIETLVARTAP